MYYRVEITIGNAAFNPEPGPELARILRKLANRIEWEYQEALGSEIRLLDYNGNAVGTAALSEI